MTEQAISPLRRRMIEDMTIRKFAQKPNMTMCDGQGVRELPQAIRALIGTEGAKAGRESPASAEYSSQVDFRRTANELP